MTGGRRQAQPTRGSLTPRFGSRPQLRPRDPAHLGVQDEERGQCTRARQRVPGAASFPLALRWPQQGCSPAQRRSLPGFLPPRQDPASRAASLAGGGDASDQVRELFPAPFLSRHTTPATPRRFITSEKTPRATITQTSSRSSSGIWK